jgi:hypothetical protein
MTYREKIIKEKPECVNKYCLGGVRNCPGTYFEGAPTQYCLMCKGINDANCRDCWDREIPDETTKEPTSFQEDMMAVLGDMTKVQAKEAIEFLWNKYFKEEQV